MKGWGQQNCVVPVWKPKLSQGAGPKMVHLPWFFILLVTMRSQGLVAFGSRAQGWCEATEYLDSHPFEFCAKRRSISPTLGAVGREKREKIKQGIVLC
jgi:hypothetical protein